MGLIAVLAIIGLGAATWLAPAPAAVAPSDPPAVSAPALAVCPLLEAGDRNTDIVVASSVDGLGVISGFAAGSVTGTTEYRTGAEGSVRVPASEVGVVDAAGGLVELPTDSTAAGVVISGPASAAAEPCADAASTESYIVGGSTAGQDSFALQILNPYAGEAILDLSVVTEAGLETNDRFEDLIVPPLSTVNLRLEEIIPGRASIAVTITASQGAVIVFGRQTVGDEIAVWQAVEGGLDWWIPVPGAGQVKDLKIGTPSSGEVQYQVDYYGPDGLMETWVEGVLDQGGSERHKLLDEGAGLAALHVLSTGPVVPMLWMETTSGGVAATAGSPTAATTWLLPGATAAGEGSAILVVNAGVDPVTVSARPLRASALAQVFTVPPEKILSIRPLEADGYRIEASGPVVASWIMRSSGLAIAMGVPLEDG